MRKRRFDKGFTIEVTIEKWDFEGDILHQEK